jgi:hypothetical protein
VGKSRFAQTFKREDVFVCEGGRFVESFTHHRHKDTSNAGIGHKKRQKIAIVIKDINLTYTLLVLLSLSNFSFRPSIDTVFFHIVKFPFEHLLGLSLSPYIDVIRLDLGGVG